MPRNFFIQESQLDDYQHLVINSTASSLVVKGCAGSGKSILALWKAKRQMIERYEGDVEQQLSMKTDDSNILIAVQTIQ